MYTVRPTSRFQKDLKKIHKRGYDISRLTKVIKILSSGEPLPQQYRDHPLVDRYTGCRECCITPAWRLIYELSAEDSVLYLTRTGTRSDVF